MSGDTFGTIVYDKKSLAMAVDCRAAFENVEDILIKNFEHHSLELDTVMQRLEEAHMWLGKAIKSEQIMRNVNSSVEDLE